MESFIAYLIRCALISGLLTSYYVLVLRGRRMHGFNRFYLLSSVAMALVLPLVHIHWAPWAANPVIVERVFVTLTAPVESGGAFWWRLAIGCCVLVSIVLLLVSLAKIRALSKLKRASRCTRLADYDLVETDAPGTPFSFFRNLFWRRGMDRDEAINRKMLAHELAHIRGRHSWDIIGMQMVVCMFWMNPFFWYVRRELTMVLEFEADAASGAEGDPEALARMLLQAYQGGLSPALANSFFYSPIKRRLVMITNTQPGRRTWMRKALVAPVILGAVLFFACSKNESPQAAKAATTRTPTIMVDDPIVAKKLMMDSARRITITTSKGPRIMTDDAKQAKIVMDSIQVVNLRAGAGN